MKNLFPRRAIAAAFSFAFITPVLSQTVSDDERITALEARVQQLESVPPPQAAPASAGAFNPAISLILSGIYANLSQDPANYRITNFPAATGVEIGPGTRGFSLTESELGITANIDPYFYGSLAYSLRPDNTASMEEAYVQTIALSHGNGVKAGRFFSAIGYLNSQHAHTWDFVDAPLVYQAFLGTQFGDDGVQVKWLAPTVRFLELGAELGRGAPYPGTNDNKNGSGAGTLFVHAGDDLGVSHSWRAGISMLATAPRNRQIIERNLAGSDVTNAFTGDSCLWIADLVWKWAPNGNPVYKNFKLQAEYMRREEKGDLTFDATNTLGAASTSSYDARQSGWYLQAVYQFRPYWRFGVRTDRLQRGTANFGSNSTNLALANFDPSRNSVMVDYSPSEFSRIRLQLAEDKARQRATDHQAFLQYQMSIGAHGAHQF